MIQTGCREDPDWMQRGSRQDLRVLVCVSVSAAEYDGEAQAGLSQEENTCTHMPVGGWRKERH